MNRASPAEIRRALEAASAYSKAGILFVPIPVLDAADHTALIEQAAAKIEKMVEMCEQV